MASFLLDQLRAAVHESPKSRAQLAKAAGVSEPHPSLMMAGAKGLSIEAVERLADAMGMTVVLVQQPTQSTRRRTRRKAR